jgi:hypothetical protein
VVGANNKPVVNVRPGAALSAEIIGIDDNSDNEYQVPKEDWEVQTLMSV